MNDQPCFNLFRRGLAALFLTAAALGAPSGCGLLPPPGAADSFSERGESDSDSDSSGGDDSGCTYC